MGALRRVLATVGVIGLVSSGVVALTSAPAGAAGATWYVATTGFDDFTCGTTVADPCKTLGWVNHTRGTSGDTINMAPGVYDMSGASVDGAANSNGRLGFTIPMTIQKDPSTTGDVILDGGGVSGVAIIQVNSVPSSTFTIRNLTIRNGSGGLGNQGAGMSLVGGTTVLENVVLSGHTTSGTGGAMRIESSGTLVMTGGAFTGNSAGKGGALYVNFGKATITGTSFTGNTAASGGAINKFNGSITLDSVVMTGNTATAVAGDATSGRGGAITHEASASLVVKNSTLSGNSASSAGGALYADEAQFLFEGTTVSGNNAPIGSAFSATSPTGVNSSTVTVRRSTISGNAGAGSSISAGHRSRVVIAESTIVDEVERSGSGLVYLGASIVTGACTVVSGATGFTEDMGYNLVPAAGSGCTSAATSVVGDPALDALANNGGLTQTHRPDGAGAAIDRVPVNHSFISPILAPVVMCASGATDQRGVPLPQGATCDVGSVEGEHEAPFISGPSAGQFIVGSSGELGSYSAQGFPTPTLTATGLPGGLALTTSGPGGGSITGTPDVGTGSSDHPVTLTATSHAGTSTLTVHLTIYEKVAITGPASPTFVEGVSGSADYDTTGGFGANAFSLTGALPSGLSFDAATGTISGIPGAGTAGAYPVTVVSTNEAGATSYPATITVVPPAPVVTGPSTGTFIVGQAGTLPGFSATGVPTPTLSATGLPGGLALSSTGPGTAEVTGTPNAGTGGNHTVTVTASNPSGSASMTVTLTVYEKVTITGPTSPTFVEGTPGSTDYDTVGGFGTNAFSLTGTLPSGLTFAPATGTISGTPAEGTAGTHGVTVVSTNQAGATTYPVTITVVPTLVITSASLPAGSNGTPYSTSLAAAGGVAPYTWALAPGSALPAGLTLTSGGTISGVPMAPAGTYAFSVTATDSGPVVQSATKALSITINAGPTVLVVQKVLIRTNPLGVPVGRLDARLLGGAVLQPLPGQTVTFRAGNTTVCTATTTSTGEVTCRIGVIETLLVILNGGVTASYEGNAMWQPAVGSAGLL